MSRALQLVPAERVKGSPLTPELKSFIDCAIVPILVREYLEQEKEIAQRTETVASSASMTDFLEAETVP